MLAYIVPIKHALKFSVYCRRNRVSTHESQEKTFFEWNLAALKNFSAHSENGFVLKDLEKSSSSYYSV